jgi:sugar phosphate permease
VLRSLALSTVAVPRHLLEEWYSPGAESEADLPRSLQQPRRQNQHPQSRPAATPATANDDSSLTRDALLLILLATAVSFICSIDRAAMSVAILPMAEQFSWDDGAKGAVSSAFFAGYMVTNLCGGFLATRYSPKRVLGAGVVLWSLFTIATPMAAGGTLPELMAAR